MRRIIINGDDFGMTASCSRAIARAFSERLITDTTMMANGAYFDDAISLAKAQGFADRVGVHFNLTEGRPLTEAICSLSDFVTDGRFNRHFLQAPHPLGEAAQAAVCAELSAQIDRIAQVGIAPTHADSHHYIHTLTHLAPLVAAVCRAHGIDRIRLNRTLDTPSHPRITENRMDNAFWHDQGFRTTRHFGRLTDIGAADIPDLCELMAHPDLDRSGNLIDRVATTEYGPIGQEIAATLSHLTDFTPISYVSFR